MAAAQPAFETTMGEDVGCGNLSGEAQRVFEGKRKEGNSKSDALGELGGGAEECQRIGRNRKFLEEMMINHGVDIETDLIGMLDLTEDFPGHVGMGFSGRGLHLRVDAESHGSSGTIRFQVNRTVRALAYALEAASVRSRTGCFKISGRVPAGSQLQRHSKVELQGQLDLPRVEDRARRPVKRVW